MRYMKNIYRVYLDIERIIPTDYKHQRLQSISGDRVAVEAGKVNK